MNVSTYLGKLFVLIGCIQMEPNSVLNQTGLQNFVEVFKTKKFYKSKTLVSESHWTLDINQKRKKKKKEKKRG